MKYRLINPMNPNFNAIEQILTNRGISYEQIPHYLHTTDEDINSYEDFGLEKLKEGAKVLIKTIAEEKDALVIVDCDCDGYTSSAVLINYLFDIAPAWVQNHLKWFMHEGKVHGLSDSMEYIGSHDFSLVICPDSSSNDYSYHHELKEKGISVLVLDHHEADHISEDAIIINNQLSNYPNKDFSGVGVVWQFCRYLDSLQNTNFSNNYLDLVALGLTGDMMSLTSIETKHIINKGFQEENIKNPFIYSLVQKNSYSLGSHITPIGAAFYLVPYVNAMVRSGTLEEMKLLFNSMLKFKAHERIPSTKRGHAKDETETIVEQAVRTVGNVKNRQTRTQDKGLESLEGMIESKNLTKHKVLLFLLENGEMDSNLLGLIANKIMAKYQRPVCILTKVKEKNSNVLTLQEEEKIYYRGSARGYNKSGVESFRQICLGTDDVEYAEGHANAFGLSILETDIEDFLQKTDLALANMESDPIYRVDYIYKGVDVSEQNILDIASLNDLWGQDIEESLICVEDLKVSADMIRIMGLEKGKPTLKITLPNKISLIKFGSSEEEYNSLLSEGYMSLNIIGKCDVNEWNGVKYPQIMIEDYEITGKSKYNF